MHKLLCGILVTLCLSSVPVIAAIDPGGSVAERIREIDHMNKANADEFHLPKICLSACTLYLGLNKVCMEPKSVLGFHSSSDGNGKIDEEVNEMVKVYYPDTIVKWIEDNHAMDTLKLTFMKSETAYSLGIKNCKDETN